RRLEGISCCRHGAGPQNAQTIQQFDTCRKQLFNESLAMSEYSARLITSLQNQQVKQVAKLEKRSERERERLLPVEGSREVSRALAAGQVPIAAYVCPELVADAEMEPVLRT